MSGPMSVTEYEPILRAGNGLSGESFDQLLNMAELLRTAGADLITEYNSSLLGKGAVAQGCAGHIVFRDGSALDIVPRLGRASGGTGNPNSLLMRMLYTIFDMPVKDFREGDAMNLFEFFVMIFVHEVSHLVNKGLRFTYMLHQNNETVFKGRILFSDNIRENYIHRERVYVEYELFSPDRAENRLIKTTLEILLKRTVNRSNRKNIKILLMNLEGIPASYDVSKDFEMCNMDRNMADYVSPMVWCNIFLRGMAGSTGGRTAYALVLDMDDLLSAYVAKMSVKGRSDGTFSIRYSVRVETDDAMKGSAGIFVDIKWSYFRSDTQTFHNDAEKLFMSAPGRRAIPPAGGISGQAGSVLFREHPTDRMRAMAEGYLMDAVGTGTG